jgi:hypothetical protein
MTTIDHEFPLGINNYEHEYILKQKVRKVIDKKKAYYLECLENAFDDRDKVRLNLLIELKKELGLYDEI